MNARIIYVYDTLCGWCKVVRPEIVRLFDAVGYDLPVVVLHRRLFVGVHVPVIDEAILQKVRRVGWKAGPLLTGQQFSEAYIDLIQRADFNHDSHLTALACAAAQRLVTRERAIHH